MKIPELLAPAGDFTGLKAAVEAGCDSIYLGVKELNMRASAKNFELGELKKAAAYCHDNNVRAYLCLNTIIYEDELEKVKKILTAAKEAGIDAIICWDMAVIRMAKEMGFELHLSTQASAANSQSLRAYEELGISRVILARECTLEQIKELKQKTSLKLECFVHGARCISISGKCFISQELFGKSANRGECLQPCRRTYRIIDAEENHELEIEHNYILSPKDLCALPFLDKLVDAGIDCIKIEGRTRAPEYVKAVAAVYCKALDAIASNKFSKELVEALSAALGKVYHRDFSPGFFLGMPANDYAGSYGNRSLVQKRFVGLVNNYYNKIGVAEIKLQSGNLEINDKLMIQGRATGVKEQIITSMQINHVPVQKAGKGQHTAVKINFKARKNDKVFLIKTRSQEQVKTISYP